MPLSVTPTLAPDEADDTTISARKSLAGTSRREGRPETSPPAAHDRRGRLRRDGPGTGWGSCSGRSSSSRLHSRWTRASLVVLALLALVVAPGTTFVTATESQRARGSKTRVKVPTFTKPHDDHGRRREQLGPVVVGHRQRAQPELVRLRARSGGRRQHEHRGFVQRAQGCAGRRPASPV